jgi:hypothetical protein
MVDNPRHTGKSANASGLALHPAPFVIHEPADHGAKPPASPALLIPQCLAHARVRSRPILLVSVRSMAMIVRVIVAVVVMTVAVIVVISFAVVDALLGAGRPRVFAEDE